jgi:hypothetical protein
LAFEFFDSEKTKVVVEMNKNLGNMLFQSIPYVFDNDNEYGDFIFLRYKHNQNDKLEKKGLLVGRNKKYMIKEFQDNVYKDNLSINNSDNIIEIKSFAKKETPSGDITYKSQTGHDDMVMTLVNISSVFNHNMYKEMVEYYIENDLPDEYNEIITGFKNKVSNKSINILKDAHNKIYSNNNPNNLFFGNKNINNPYKLMYKDIPDWYNIGNNKKINNK